MMRKSSNQKRPLPVGDGIGQAKVKRIRMQRSADTQKQVMLQADIDASESSEDSSESGGSDSDIDDDEVSVDEINEEPSAADIERLPLMFYLHAKTQLQQKCSNSTLQHAIASLKKSRSLLLIQNEELQRLLEKALKRRQNLSNQCGIMIDKKVPPGSSQVQREVSDDRFLLCSVSVAICKVHLSLGDDPRAALDAAIEALIWFPRSVEGNYLLGEVLRGNSSCVEDIAAAEGCYRKAIETASFLDYSHIRSSNVSCSSSSAAAAATDDPNPAATATESCTKEKREKFSEKDLSDDELNLELVVEEKEAGRAAQEALALLLFQNDKNDEGDELLQSLKYEYRLSRSVFRYPLTDDEVISKTDESNGDGSIVRVVDSALNMQSVKHLQHVFRPDSPYWKEHDYDTVLNASRTAGYVSYMFPFSKGTDALTSVKKVDDESSIEQIIRNFIFPIVQKYFPRVKEETNYVEWWVHTRPHGNGHQLHFDSDETRIESGQSPHHPLVSTVLYLDHDNVNISSDCTCTGGPTLITNQTLDGNSLASKGWMVLPKNNRLVMFDAQYLHGVIPGRGINPRSFDSNSRRLTFMVGFWSKFEAIYRGVDTPGPGQPFPQLNASRYTWPLEMKPFQEIDDDSERERQQTEAKPLSICSVWERVNGSQSLKKYTPSYDKCFQGF